MNDNKTIILTSIILVAIAIFISTNALAAQWKLSYEHEISDTRKVCVYEDPQGNTKHIEQSKSQYCRSYI